MINLLYDSKDYLNNFDPDIWNAYKNILQLKIMLIYSVCIKLYKMDNDLFANSEYHELLLRLERANDALAYYKSNKEISLRDLQK